MSKFLIAGLGNIGDEYTETRHNIGFEVVDFLASKFNTKFSIDKHAYVCEVKYKSRILVLIKPTTYMNLSGKAINYHLQQNKIQLDKALIITDDIALPFGTLRMKGKGSDGGHNGLKNIQEILKSTEYARLRMGIGNNFSKGSQVNYVLGKWGEQEKKLLPLVVEKAADAALSFTEIGLQLTMTNHNKVVVELKN